MDRDPLLIVVIIACMFVAGVLAFGIGAFAKGGKFNQKYGNLLMRARTVCQGGTIVCLLLMFFTGGLGN